MRVDRLDVDRGKPAGSQHLGQRPSVALVALDSPAFYGVRRAARVHADHRRADRFKRPEQVRREWATLEPDLIQGSLEPLQGAVDHFRMGIDGSSPHRLARPVDDADRRSLAADIQPCIHPHRSSPFVAHESPAKGLPDAGEQQPHVRYVLVAVSSDGGTLSSDGFERFWDRAPSTAARRSTDAVQEFVAYIKRAGPRRQCVGARLGLLWFDLVLNARHAWRHGSGPTTAWS